jgi:uncharacterized damage-inducible protein DinB
MIVTMTNEVERFLQLWDIEAKKTITLLQSLPADQYDFKPDAGGRSLGELAWHLSEVEAYTSLGIEQGGFARGMRPPGIERPKTIEALAPGYERIHADAVARLGGVTAADLDRTISSFGGDQQSIRDLLWSALLFQLIHHRGQLSVLCRLAGGVAPGLFGPNREETARLRARASS